MQENDSGFTQKQKRSTRIFNFIKIGTRPIGFLKHQRKDL